MAGLQKDWKVVKQQKKIYGASALADYLRDSDAKFWSSELTNSFLFLPAPNFSVMLCRSVPFLAAVSNCNGSFGSKIPGKRVGGGGDAETLLHCDSCQLVLSLFGIKPRKIMMCRLVGVRS